MASWLPFNLLNLSHLQKQCFPCFRYGGDYIAVPVVHIYTLPGIIILTNTGQWPLISKLITNKKTVPERADRIKLPTKIVIIVLFQHFNLTSGNWQPGTTIFDTQYPYI